MTACGSGPRPLASCVRARARRVRIGCGKISGHRGRDEVGGRDE